MLARAINDVCKKLKDRLRKRINRPDDAAARL
jgi:hypothetical protein